MKKGELCSTIPIECTVIYPACTLSVSPESELLSGEEDTERQALSCPRPDQKPAHQRCLSKSFLFLSPFSF